MTIWKFPLDPTALTLPLPQHARLLTVQVQQGRPVLWALVDPAAPILARSVGIYGTGHDVPAEPGEYVGTFQLPAEGLVFHVFIGELA